MNLNSRFKSMFDVGKEDIENEYRDTLQRIEEGKAKSYEKFMKSPDYVSGVTNPGMDQIGEYFNKQTAAANKNYRDKLRKYRMSLQQKRNSNRAFNTNYFQFQSNKKK